VKLGLIRHIQQPLLAECIAGQIPIKKLQFSTKIKTLIRKHISQLAKSNKRLKIIQK